MVSELIKFSTVVGDIYDAAIDPTLWQKALGSICAYVGGLSGVLYWHDSASERSEALHLFNEDPVYTRLYFEKYLLQNPMFPAATFLDEGVVASDDDIMPRSELMKTRFYKEWLKPQGIVSALSVNLEKGVASASMINVRMTVLPTEEMRYRLRLLVPHLLRAVTIGRLFDQSKATTQALTETFDHVEAAVFLVGADAAITFANEAAQKMLGEEAIVRKEDGALRAVRPDANRLLRDIFVSAEKGDSSVGVRGVAVPLTDKPQEGWFAHVLPLTSGRRERAGQDHAAVAAVFIRNTVPDAPSPLEAIVKLYKLTAGEAKIIDAVLKANGVKAMAEMLGLSQATVKTHLHNVFLKTRTRRQSDLVKLVAGI